MGWSSSGIIFYLGDYGGGDRRIRNLRLPFVEGEKPTNTDVWSVVLALDTYTQANWGAYENIKKWTGTNESPDIGANLDIKARIAFKDSADGKIYRIELPAPVAGMFDIQGEGDRVNPTILGTIVTALSTAYGRTFVPLWGKKIQRS